MHKDMATAQYRNVCSHGFRYVPVNESLITWPITVKSHSSGFQAGIGCPGEWVELAAECDGQDPVERDQEEQNQPGGAGKSERGPEKPGSPVAPALR